MGKSSRKQKKVDRSFLGFYIGVFLTKKDPKTKVLVLLSPGLGDRTTSSGKSDIKAAPDCVEKQG